MRTNKCGVWAIVMALWMVLVNVVSAGTSVPISLDAAVSVSDWKVRSDGYESRQFLPSASVIGISAIEAPITTSVSNTVFIIELESFGAADDIFSVSANLKGTPKNVIGQAPNGGGRQTIQFTFNTIGTLNLGFAFQRVTPNLSAAGWGKVYKVTMVIPDVQSIKIIGFSPVTSAKPGKEIALFTDGGLTPMNQVIFYNADNSVAAQVNAPYGNSTASAKFITPNIAAGTYLFAIRNANGVESPKVHFTILDDVPTTGVTSTAGAAGTSVTVTGNNFTPSGTVNFITPSGLVMASVPSVGTTSTATFTVPTIQGGTYGIQVVTSTGQKSAKIAFSVNPEPAPGPITSGYNTTTKVITALWPYAYTPSWMVTATLQGGGTIDLSAVAAGPIKLIAGSPYSYWIARATSEVGIVSVQAVPRPLP